MSKKSQISILVIIALLLLVSMIFLINTQYEFKVNDLKDDGIFINQNQVRVKNLVDDCLERQSEHAFDWVMIQGGYYDLGKYNKDPVIRYLKDGDNLIILNKNEIFDGMKYYLEDTMPFCINNFNNFPEFEIIDSNMSFYIGYTSDRISVDLEYPLEVRTINSNYNFHLDSFKYNLNVENLDTIIIDVNNFVSEFNKEFDGTARAKYVVDLNNSRKDLNIEILKVKETENEGIFTTFFLYDLEVRKVPFAFSIRLKNE